MSNHISLDEIYLLLLSEQGYRLEDFKERKISSLIVGLKRKAYLSDEGTITQAGKTLLHSLSLPGEDLELNRIEKTADAFERFWKAFPPTDTVRQGDKILYKGGRGLKDSKDKCREKFHAILSEGEYTAEDIIQALQYEVNLKIQKSIETKTNKLTYLKNCHAWLNQRAFEAWISESKEKESQAIIPKNFDAVDI